MERGNSASRPVPRRSLDALFRHVLKPEPELLARVRELGYDPEAPEPFYPVGVFKDCLELARSHLFAHLPEDEGYRRLGEIWVDGYTQTAVGTVLGAAARLIGPHRCLARVPSYMKAAREEVEVEVDALGPLHWRVVMFDPVRPLPHMTVGVLHAIMRLTGVHTAVITVERSDAQSYELHVKWS